MIEILKINIELYKDNDRLKKENNALRILIKGLDSSLILTNRLEKEFGPIDYKNVYKLKS